jgi:hypothetical protein
MTPLDIDPIFGIDQGDRSIWARQIIDQQKHNGKAVPLAVDLESAVTSIDLSDAMRASGTVEIGVRDVDWRLTDSGFFDANENGILDRIEVNYPEGSDFWWRLSQVGTTKAGNGADLTLSFMERAPWDVMEHHGPLKFNRSKVTRAEAVLSLLRRVKQHGGITLHSKDLHVTQPIEGEREPRQKDEKDRKKAKDPGIHRKDRISFTFWDGSTVTLKPDELRNAEIVLDEATRHTTVELPLMALNCACIVEGPMFRNGTGGDHGKSNGILQLTNDKYGGNVAEQRNIPRVVKDFLTKGFTGKGGAIELARNHPNWTAGHIAQEVQGSGFPDRYDKVRDGALLVLRAYGGSSGLTTTVRKQYNFQVGVPGNRKEDFYIAVLRWADEVNWPFFFHGQDAYFDPEMTLIRQKPAAVIHRDDSTVVAFDSTIDARHVASEATIDLICDPYEFRAGEVFVLRGFGAASSASTAKLPGRWLISEWRRPKFSLVTSFTLKQPEQAEPEPAPETTTRSRSGEFGTGPQSGAKGSDIYQACLSVDQENRPYLWGGGHKAISDISAHEGLDCSGAVSLALKRAGMFNGSTGITSGTFASSWGESGRGNDFTVWANAGHVFLQSETADWRFDTSGGPPGGPHIRNSKRDTGGFTPRHWKGR